MFINFVENMPKIRNNERMRKFQVKNTKLMQKKLDRKKNQTNGAISKHLKLELGNADPR